MAGFLRLDHRTRHACNAISFDATCYASESLRAPRAPISTAKKVLSCFRRLCALRIRPLLAGVLRVYFSINHVRSRAFVRRSRIVSRFITNYVSKLLIVLLRVKSRVLFARRSRRRQAVIIVNESYAHTYLRARRNTILIHRLQHACMPRRTGVRVVIPNGPNRNRERVFGGRKKLYA